MLDRLIIHVDIRTDSQPFTADRAAELKRVLLTQALDCILGVHISGYIPLHDAHGHNIGGMTVQRKPTGGAPALCDENCTYAK